MILPVKVSINKFTFVTASIRPWHSTSNEIKVIKQKINFAMIRYRSFYTASGASLHDNYSENKTYLF